MNEIWANRLVAGTKTWDQVPAPRKDEVKAVLEKRLERGQILQGDWDRIFAEQ